MNRRTLILAITVVLAGTLVFPSAASPLFAGGTDQLGSDVGLTPSSDYAYLDADDELVVDISPANPDLDGDGVNADARTTIGDAFHVRYNGSRYAHVWLTHGSDAVTFAVDGQPVQSQANNVTLAPNESVPVSLTIDTTGRVDGLVDDITIHSRVADPVTADSDVDETAGSDGIDGVAKRSVAPTDHTRQFTVLSAEPGTATGFNASRLAIDSTGDLTLDRVSTTGLNRSYSVTAETTGVGDGESAVVDAGAEPLGAVRMTVDPGTVSGATMSFSVPAGYFDDRDIDPAALAVYRDHDGALSEHDVTMTGERRGRITFEAETPGFSTFVVAEKRPRLAVVDAELSATTVAPGESVTVTASVSNSGSIAGGRTVTVRIDGEVAGERTVDVAPGATETVTVPLSRNETGEYAVNVDGVEAGSVSVTTEDTPSETDPATATATATESTASTDDTSETPIAEPGGFGLRELLGLLGLLVVLAVVLVLARRTPRP